MVVPSEAPQSGPLGGVRSGLCAAVRLVVTDADTAEHFRSGDVPVLATPRLVALCEEASCRAVTAQLPPEHTSVGTRVQFDHLLPVPVGQAVVAEATLEKVEGRRLVFTLSVSLDAPDHGALVAAGRLTRVVVERPRFMTKAGCEETPTSPSVSHA